MNWDGLNEKLKENCTERNTIRLKNITGRGSTTENESARTKCNEESRMSVIFVFFFSPFSSAITMVTLVSLSFNHLLLGRSRVPFSLQKLSQPCRTLCV